jgi:DNA-binding CsgD family transcriptional regulator
MLLLGEGKRAAQVARILGLRSNTVSFHKRRVMERLGIGSEAGLVRFAVLTSLGGRGER